MPTTSPIDLPNLPAAVIDLVNQIPTGSVSTFGELASALGDVVAARWIGEFLLRPDVVASCPAHRVVLKSGDLGRFHTGDSLDKQRLLEAEGVAVTADRVDLASIGFDAFTSERPLARLRETQEKLPSRVREETYDETPERVAGVDTSYCDDGTAVACYAEVEAASGELVWSHTVRRAINFPYLTGYLAYRELPILLALLSEVINERGHQPAPVVMVDGQGRLHPRRSGIAVHLGVEADVRTIGIGKKLLCGNVDLDEVTPSAPQPVVHDNEVIGMALRAEEYSRPIFVSPGNKIDVANATRLTTQLFQGHRLPEPVYFADRLSRDATS